MHIKKLKIVFFFCFFTAILLQGQTHQPLVVENAQWFYYHTLSGSIFFDRAYNYKISGDSVLNNITYKKVLYRSMYAINNDDYLPVALYPNDTGVLCALIREDSAAKKIYVISLDLSLTFVEPWSWCSINQEELLFDYSVNVGDSINLCLFGPGGVAITKIDSVNSYGKFRKAYYYGNYSAVYIEGIGTESGLFNSLGGDLSGNSWFFYNHCVGTDQDCGIQFLSINDKKRKRLSLHPNPSNNRLTISNIHEKDDYIIVNTLGEIIQRGVLQKGVNEIGISNLSSGVYFIKMSSHSTVKFIKT